MEKLWTTREAAQVLGVTERDIQQLVREGKLTGYKLGGQFLRFRPDQVESLKGQIAFRRHVGRPAQEGRRSWLNRVSDFVYFHDFYLVSGVLLALLVVYLVASG